MLDNQNQGMLTPMPPSPTLLIADDEPDIRAMLKKLFAGEPYRLVFAENGAEALALAEKILPDVILLDVMMPYLDGLEVCRRLRADARLGGVPIVLITGLADQTNRLAGIEAGADDFFSKPFERVEVLARVRAMLQFNRYRQRYREHARLETAHQQAEDALRESEDKFKYVFDHSVVGKSITRLTGETHVNYALCDMLGYTREELNGQTWQALTHPDDIGFTQDHLNKLLSGEAEAVRLTKRYRHKSGALVWAEVGVALRRDPNGQPLYYITTINNITTQRQAENALRESEERLRVLFEELPIGVTLLDQSRRVLYANPAFHYRTLSS
jgi:PAS domain S-box-containing protein